MKLKDIFLILLVFSCIFLFFFMTKKKPCNCELPDYSRLHEKIRSDSLRIEKYKRTIDHSRAAIDSIEKIKQETKIIYYEKINNIRNISNDSVFRSITNYYGWNAE